MPVKVADGEEPRQSPFAVRALPLCTNVDMSMDVVEVVETLRALRGMQENSFKSGRQRAGIDHLDEKDRLRVGCPGAHRIVDGIGGTQRLGIRRQGDGQGVGQRGTSGRAHQIRSRPAEHLLGKARKVGKPQVALAAQGGSGR